MRQKRRGRKRKCRHCEKMYLPDPRTRDRQKHCSVPECQQASKSWRQQRWLNQPENRDYFRGPHHVLKTQEWRKAHPGYWRRVHKTKNALQDDCASEPVAAQWDKCKLSAVALQDDCLLQPSLVVGLIAQLTGCTLQDDIAMAVRRMHARGQSILGMGPGIERGGNGDDRQTFVVP